MKFLHSRTALAAPPALLTLLLAMPGGAHAQAAGQWKDPATLFKSTCAYCHDQSLVKGIGPELLGRALPAATVAYFVRHGFGAMPAFPEAQISPAELAQLGSWIAQSPLDSLGKKP